MNNLIKYLDNSFTAFHAVKNIEELLKNNQFIKLNEQEDWVLEPNKSYYVIRNTSSIIAFKTPSIENYTGFNIVASHSDSPSYKIKPNATIKDLKNDYTKLNTETYGGPITYSWFDRPLGIAGRVFFEEENFVKEEIVNLDTTIIIPSVAIHLNRSGEFNPNPQVDMLPLFGDSTTTFEDILNKQFNNQKILSTDLFLYNKEKATLVGSNNEYLSSSRIDDLECAYISTVSLINSNPTNISINVVFNNEEVGSRSANGAASTFLKDITKRIAQALNKDYYKLLANSFIISSDNAHALHPNHPEKADPTNMVYMNKGIVVKHQAGLNYTTDALSEAIFKKICNLVSVPYQDYTNRSDQRGGGTLGAISQSQLSIPSVDIGLAQLAMHSTYETCGTKDITYLQDALTKFFNIKIINNNNNVEIK